MGKRKDDMDMGLNFEERFLNKYPNAEKLGHYDAFDYYYDGVLYELKSRRCKSTTYGTTKIPMKKYLEGWRRLIAGECTDIVLVVEWTDFIGALSMAYCPPIGTCYDKGRCDRGKDESAYYAFFEISKFRTFII